MKFELIKINDCVDCPHKVWRAGERICLKAGDRIIDAFIGDLPDWCLLTDIEYLVIKEPEALRKEVSEWENT